MLAIFVACFAALMLFGIALALGQFFGREPVTPKCNPGQCCMQGGRCRRRAIADKARNRDA